MKNNTRLLSILLLAVILLTPTAAAAQSTTYTYAVDARMSFVRTQDAYLPERTVMSLDLRKPEDIFFDKNDLLYIADTGNRRLLVFNIATDSLEQTITHPDFNMPRGVFVTGDGTIYVADSAAGKVFCFTPGGEFIRTYSRPDSVAYGDTAFAPMRVAVDLRGNLYIVGEGVYNGVIQLSRDGEFLGFFAANQATRTFFQFLQDLFMTDAQKAGLTDRLPSTFSNIFATKQGIVYSTSITENIADRVKKHNVAGANMFLDIWASGSLVDLYVNDDGIVFCANSFGYIDVLTADGNFIFEFGASSATQDIAGTYTALASLAVSKNGELWTLDSEKGFLQSYKPTDYALSIYKALTLLEDGLYEESGEQWNEVLRYNQMSVIAHFGLGKSLLYRQQYAQAQEHFRLAGYRELYSEAFWETRNIWLQNNLYWFLILVVVLILLSLALKYLDRKHRVRGFIKGIKTKLFRNDRMDNILFGFYLARHPLDGYYFMKRKERGTMAAAIGYYILFFLSFMVFQTAKAFILQTTAVEDIDTPMLVGGFFAITLLFVVCNYLVTSIKDGNGTLNEVFKSVAFGSLPLSIALLLYTLLSYALTFNEVFILDLLLGITAVWSIVIIYLGLQEVHSYNVKNNVFSLFITASFMAIAFVVVLNLSILGEQFADFVESVGRELAANVTGTR